MPAPQFIQIHTLHNYSGALLNRDDTGFAKTMPYGGITRTRISSQCLKRHWRKAEGVYALTNIAPDPMRTREMTEKAIMKRVRVQANDLDEAFAKDIIEELNKGLYGDKGNDENSRQPLLYGVPEAEYLSDKVLSIIDENPDHDLAVAAVKQLMSKKAEGDNFAAFQQSQALPAGVIGAMFGRMMTSDPNANIDAAVHVAHAFTTHGEEKEIDYFTAMEDLTDDPGAGHIGDVEINSGIYYSYVCIDMRGLTANTTGHEPEEWLDAERDIAAQTAASLVGLIATVSPGAKKGSTAPYAYAKAMLVEAGERQPRSLSAAYREPSQPHAEDALNRLKAEITALDETYGTHEARRMMVAIPGLETENTLQDLTEWVKNIVEQGTA